MPSVKKPGKTFFEQQWLGNLSEYVTAIAWSADDLLAASSAAGQVILWQDGNLISLLPEGLESIDCLAFSADGRFLAAGGQDGKVEVWSMNPSLLKGIRVGALDLIATLDNAPSWIDKLAWSPIGNYLAFSVGRYVQIWSADTQAVVTTLPFEDSSVLDLAWRPSGEEIAIAGNGGVKVWSAKDWDSDPYLIDMPTASIFITWSGDGKYIASGNLDKTITVLEYGIPHPWVIRGFPGKVVNLAWSSKESSNVPWLTASSMEVVAVWEKQAEDEDGWNPRILTFHDRKVQALKFHPHNLLLASAGDDGHLCLWTKAKQIGQVLEGAKGGFSCLAWSQNGKQLAAGGQNGELIIWSESGRGKGFG
ncbi:MAG: hypothetical protein AAFQ41_03560 [Cyanobacteria bacterium J06623_7]